VSYPRQNSNINRPRRLDAQKMEELGLSGDGPIYVQADLYQASTLNLLLPKGFKLELEESVLKAM